LKSVLIVNQCDKGFVASSYKAVKMHTSNSKLHAIMKYMDW